MIAPSCPALVIHEDDAFRKSLIAALDVRHFTVTFAEDDDEALRALGDGRAFRVVLLGLDLKSRKGFAVLDALQNRDRKVTSLIVVGEPDPELRMRARAADETMLKPVDPAYVADRARVYCGN